MNRQLCELRDILVRRGKSRLKKPRSFVEFTKNKEADVLVNDLKAHPHAFVIGCIMDRQISAEKAWQVPYRLKDRLGYFDFHRLSKTSRSYFVKLMLRKPALHRFATDMGENIYNAIQLIKNEYKGNAALLWIGKPSSATVVRRFLEFDGVGPKIATMAANILVRSFHVPMSDYYSIDLSVDRHTGRVFRRMGFAPEDASTEYMIYRARELWPRYPGIFDMRMWEIGEDVCHVKKPDCERCEFCGLCEYSR